MGSIVIFSIIKQHEGYIFLHFFLTQIQTRQSVSTMYFRHFRESVTNENTLLGKVTGLFVIQLNLKEEENEVSSYKSPLGRSLYH